MRLPKNLKIWVTSFIALSLLFPVPIFAQSEVKAKVINDKFIKIGGKIYGYSPKDKFIKLKEDAQKLPLKKQKVELLEKKLEKKNEIIESKNEIIAQYKEQSELMTESFNRFSESNSKGFFESEGVEKFIDVTIPIITFLFGAKLATEATE